MVRAGRAKVQRRISTGTYLAALVLTILIFSLGVYVGMIVDERAQAEVESQILGLEQDLYLSRILLLVEGEIGEFCPIYSEKLEAVDGERELIGDRLEYLESVRGVYDEELKERYFYLEFENYLLMRKMQKECEANQTLLLFFYGKGEESGAQGDVLDTLRARNPDVRVFSFDGEMDSAVVEALKDMYLVKTYPTVVLDGRRLSGPQDIEELEERIGGS